MITKDWEALLAKSEQVKKAIKDNTLANLQAELTSLKEKLSNSEAKDVQKVAILKYKIEQTTKRIKELSDGY